MPQPLWPVQGMLLKGEQGTVSAVRAPLPSSQPRAAALEPQRHPKSQPHPRAAEPRSFVGNASSCSHSALPGIPWREIEECSWSHPRWLPAAGLSWHSSCEGITQNPSFGIYILHLLQEQHWHSFFLCSCNSPKCLCRGLWQIRGCLWGISCGSLFMHLLWALMTRSGLPALLAEGSSSASTVIGMVQEHTCLPSSVPKWELKVCSGISTPKHINILGAGKGASEWECWAGSSECWKMCRNRYSGGT